MTSRAINVVTSPRIRIPLAALACVGGMILCLPSSGAASSSSGGAGIGPNSGAGGSSGSAPAPEPGNLTVSASTNGITIAARESALLRTRLRVSGSVASASGRIVAIQLRGAATRWSWESVAQTRVRGDGSFSAVWKTNHAGQLALRAVVGQASGSAASGLPTINVTVYRPAIATLYGPGFYGRRTACGERLRRRTIGVANRTLPCGTPVAIYYGGRVMVVPVIDRGPYANGASWDLTMATGKALGMYTTARIGAISLPPAR